MKEYKYKINGMKFTVAVGDIIDNEATVEVNGVPYKVELEKKNQTKIKPVLSQAGHTNHGNVAPTSSKPAPKPVIPGNAEAVKSPLPGTVMSIDVKVGDKVKSGDKVCVLEAMKMENDIRSGKEGTVTSILVKVGDAILEGTDIMIIE
ncbi:MAG: acetyl-CoA carboxylase biotin carboxyl carrier protein subunit [Bacteroidales bacterium]|nr:acetyl-CoA carboxylase biotin carboxyl carrier protein subunit [Bacteroidales bacterium]MBD5205109.1 acetyl-CoA carboxylase biotin carboxyl carrier protein subunit [Bacteroidales bacterium]